MRLRHSPGNFGEREQCDVEPQFVIWVPCREKENLLNTRKILVFTIFANDVILNVLESQEIIKVLCVNFATQLVLHPPISLEYSLAGGICQIKYMLLFSCIF